MNKDAILKTVVVRWDDTDGCYIAESPLADSICGDGETEQDALNSFKESVEINYKYYKMGKHALYPNPGRPKKGKVQLHAEISPDIKSALSAMAKEIGISQGEVIEYLLSVYKARQQSG